MSISFENALGIHEKALLLRNKRTEVIANNIANADTPGFKARDINFQEVLAMQGGSEAGHDLAGNRAQHIRSTVAVDEVTLSFRQPTQTSLDGNTVDEQQENAAFARNALDHQASFQFLNGKFTSLIKAIRGE